MEVYWVGDRELTERERVVLRELHGRAATEDVRGPVDAWVPSAVLRLLRSLPDALVYVGMSVGVLLQFGMLGETFGVLEHGDAGELVGIWHVKDGEVHPVWHRGVEGNEQVLLPGRPEDPLPERWKRFDEGIGRLIRLAFEGEAPEEP